MERAFYQLRDDDRRRFDRRRHAAGDLVGLQQRRSVSSP
jgi:hypothetical protein